MEVSSLLKQVGEPEQQLPDSLQGCTLRVARVSYQLKLLCMDWYSGRGTSPPLETVLEPVGPLCRPYGP